MKLVIILLSLACVYAELPRFRNARFHFQRQELAPSTTESSVEPTTASNDAPYPAAGGPYPPSGWKPAGEPFKLPEKQTDPSSNYGAPQQSAPYPPSGWKPAGQAFVLPVQQAKQELQPPTASYGVPDNFYGAPTTDDNDISTTELPRTDNPQAAKIQEVDIQRSEGTYFILLPNGQLQKVTFVTEDDPRKMAYTAKLQYPSRDQGPLFVLNNF